MGLATGVADVLSDSGLTVANTTDWPKGEYDGKIQKQPKNEITVIGSLKKTAEAIIVLIGFR